MLPDHALILAAGTGSRLGQAGKSLPKGLIEVDGMALVHRSVSQLRSIGIEAITIVTGHKAEFYHQEFALESDVTLVSNQNFSYTASFESLCVGLSSVQAPTLLLESDICFDMAGLHAVTRSGYRSCVLASGFTGAGDEVWVTGNGTQLRSLSKSMRKSGPAPLGEFVGISKLSGEDVRKLLELRGADVKFWRQRDYEEAVNQLARDSVIGVAIEEKLRWGEIDTQAQLRRVRALFEHGEGGNFD